MGVFTKRQDLGTCYQNFINEKPNFLLLFMICALIMLLSQNEVSLFVHLMVYYTRLLIHTLYRKMG